MRDVLGQSWAIETLHAAVATGKLHHAFIFSGPAGVGKFTTALGFAGLLLCQSPTTTLTGEIEACGTCPSCRLLDAAATQNAHPDLHVVTKELALYSDDRLIRHRKLMSIPVDVLRSALLEPVSRRASMAGGACDKVFIVDEAELLNATGQNLLLKTLEEPPARTVIILVTSSEHRLIPTIRSRCQRVTFVPLADQIVADWLDRQEEAAALSARERQWLISFAAGSLGRAHIAVSYGLVAWARAVLPDLRAMGVGDRPRTGDLGARMAELISDFAQQWVAGHTGASKEAANRLAAGLMWSMIAGYARDKVAAAAEHCDASDPGGAQAAMEPWLGVIDAVEHSARLLESNVNPTLVCDHLVATVARRFTGVAA